MATNLEIREASVVNDRVQGMYELLNVLRPGCAECVGEAPLAAIQSGELEGSAAMRQRIEGAIAALEIALGRSPRSALRIRESVKSD
jgi:hypothetical protein